MKFGVMLAVLAAIACPGVVRADGAEGARAAVCVLRVKASLVRDYMGTLPGSGDEAFAADRLAARSRGCDNGALWGSRDDEERIIARGLFAEGYLGARLPDTLPRPGARRFGQADVMRYAELGANTAALITYDMADCMIDRAWPDARALVTSDHGGTEERAAFAALAPAMTGCLAPGVKVSLKAASVRAAIAEQIWWRQGGVAVAAQ